jgi:hypothetical protein
MSPYIMISINKAMKKEYNITAPIFFKVELFIIFYFKE